MPLPIGYSVIIKPSVAHLAQVGKLMLDTKDMATFFGLTPAKVHQLISSGRIPLPMRLGLGRVVRWSVLELLDWVAAGCPKCAAWIAMHGWSGSTRRR